MSMTEDLKKIRVNIYVDPDTFPEIYAELAAVLKKKKRIDGSRILHLATAGYYHYKNGCAHRQESFPASLVSIENHLSTPSAIQNNQPASHERSDNVPASSTVLDIPADELADLEKVFSGDF